MRFENVKKIIYILRETFERIVMLQTLLKNKWRETIQVILYTVSIEYGSAEYY